MSADIEKLAVFDSRIVQSRPRYAVQKGALSLTNAPFNAISATPSQHTYNIYVPSENVFVDRAVEWSSTVLMTTTQTFTSGATSTYLVAGNAGMPLLVPGVDVALQAFPLNSLCSTMTATINDTTSVINSQDVLKEVLRLTDYKKNRLQRTCPTMLDKYQNYDDAYGSPNSPLSGYSSLVDYAEPQNGQYPYFVFTDKNGTPLVDGTYYDSTGTALAVQPPLGASAPGVYQAQLGSIPCFQVGADAAPMVGPYTFFFKWASTEKIVLSPFTFSDVHEWDTGLFGINNIQLIMNLQSPARTLRATGQRFGAASGQGTISGFSLSPAAYNTIPATPFVGSVVNVQFLTPSLDVPLPPKSVVPYMEFPRYITSASQPIAAKSTGQIQSQTITLPQIPDLLIIYVKNGLSALGSTYADSYMPLANRGNSPTANPLSVNFDNFSGLLSSQTTEQLYAMSVKNGLDMDYATWSGEAYTGLQLSTGVAGFGTVPTTTGRQANGFGVNPASSPNGTKTPLVGSILVLKPSQDITLQTGQAPSLVGNFTLQFNLTVFNNTQAAITPQLFVITANSGFFESIRGSSRIIKGVLSEQDIIGAPLAPTATTQELHRFVGGAGIMSSLGNILSKVKGPALEILKTVGMEAGKELLSHGTAFAKKKLGLGDGMSGGAYSGGVGSSGGAARLGRTRGGLEGRLM